MIFSQKDKSNLRYYTLDKNSVFTFKRIKSITSAIKHLLLNARNMLLSINSCMFDNMVYLRHYSLLIGLARPKRHLIQILVPRSLHNYRLTLAVPTESNLGWPTLTS
jgi:hypothetical protein